MMMASRPARSGCCCLRSMDRSADRSAKWCRSRSQGMHIAMQEREFESMLPNWYASSAEAATRERESCRCWRIMHIDGPYVWAPLLLLRCRNAVRQPGRAMCLLASLMLCLVTGPHHGTTDAAALSIESIHRDRSVECLGQPFESSLESFRAMEAAHMTVVCVRACMHADAQVVTRPAGLAPRRCVHIHIHNFDASTAERINPTDKPTGIHQFGGAFTGGDDRLLAPRKTH